MGVFICDIFIFDCILDILSSREHGALWHRGYCADGKDRKLQDNADEINYNITLCTLKISNIGTVCTLIQY